MTSPSVKATEALEKPPAAKPLRSRCFPDDDPKPKVNANLSRLFDTRIDTYLKKLLGLQLQKRAIYPDCNNH